MFDTLIEVVGGMLPVDLPFHSSRLRRAYRAAWAASDDDRSAAGLLEALKRHNVPGAYSADAGGELAWVLDAWSQRVQPAKLRAFHREQRGHPAGGATFNVGESAGGSSDLGLGADVSRTFGDAAGTLVLCLR